MKLMIISFSLGGARVGRRLCMLIGGGIGTELEIYLDLRS